MSLSASLLEIYDELEREAAGQGNACRACGRCCDFRANDYVLYASQIETDLVIEKTGRFPSIIDGRCCFLDEAGHCSIYPWRPLGCRTYFCERARAGRAGTRRSEHLHQQALARIKALAEQCGEEWRYGPFLSW